MYKFELKDIKFFILCFLVISFVAFIAFIPAYCCHYQAEKLGLQCKWSRFHGCMVKMPSGNWMDYDKLKYNMKTGEFK